MLPVQSRLAPQINAAWFVEQLLRSANKDFCFIGGMALFRWSEPRLTRDIDLTILCPFGDEEPLIEWLMSHLEKRLPDAKAFALKNRVLLLRHGLIDVDISLGAIDFEFRAIERSSQHLYAPNIYLTTCSAEDLIIFKAFASRGQDWVDVASIIKRCGNKLDWTIIETELTPLAMLKEQPEIMDKLRAIYSQYCGKNPGQNSR